MAWNTTNWEQDDDKNGGYPFSTSAALPTVNNTSGIYSSWTLSGEYPSISTAELPLQLGAFRGCTDLISVTIPRTVKTIGKWAFADTMLSKVRIAVDCSYFPTSFPDGCEIWHYTENGNLRDKNGLYLVDRNGKLLKVRDT